MRKKRIYFFRPDTVHHNSYGGENLLRRINAFEAGMIAFGAALNVSIGYLVSVLKLPLYLDSIGTVLISVLCGWKYGVMVGLSALVILTLTAVPTAIAYSGTVFVIAVASAVMARAGFLKSVKITVLGGLIIGLATTISSAPVTFFAFGGVSLAGSDLVTTFFKASGLPVWKSVLLGSLFTDPVDKLMTSLICLAMVRSMPSYLLNRLSCSNTLFPEITDD